MDHLFIVRIWSEGRDGDARFRGTVEHVGTRLRRHFTAAADLLSYLERRTLEATVEIGRDVAASTDEQTR